MITLVHTISLAVAERLRSVASLLSKWRRSAAQTRANRERMEAELFRDRCHLSSKNDDDLPVVR
jgi:hypothetical protein